MARPIYTDRWFLVARDECNTEVCMHPEPGETREQLRDRMPEEWRFRGYEQERDRYAEAERDYDNNESDVDCGEDF